MFHAEDIKAAIRKRGYTLGRLATENGLRENAIREVLVGRRNITAMQVVARFLGKDIKAVFGSHKYDYTNKNRKNHTPKGGMAAAAR